MLAIRMQRTGRKGHAMFRVVVQEARLTPTSGKVVALLGNYDPHAKSVTINKEKAAVYLKNGAQPSDRVARLLKAEGVTLPSWVTLEATKAGKLRNPEKLRKNQPKDAKPAADEQTDAPAEPAAEASAANDTATEQAETPSES